MTQTIVFANFLAPALHKTYQYIMEYIRQRTGIPAFLVSGASEHDFLTGAIDGGFICGLAYTHLAQQQPNPVELAAAPILIGERYQHKPRYYSDVVVRQSSRFQNLDDLRGCTWTYNEVASHSGYTLVHSTLLERGYPAPADYFGRSMESGSHAHSLRLVLDGLADAAAIDSHVLDVIASNSPP
ncbi:MAG: PhnD/SsuA/transferrin family substrate-binding protein, partial [Ktedonobacteraceae bacterium]|nr:PhnD/SsuA/transferrin family substrate-binding protein [Ktedonobacteraceae bacterium]